MRATEEDAEDAEEAGEETAEGKGGERWQEKEVMTAISARTYIYILYSNHNGLYQILRCT